MVSSWYSDDAYSRPLLPNARLGPNTSIKIICLHPETHLLCYKCYLSYISTTPFKIN